MFLSFGFRNLANRFYLTRKKLSSSSLIHGSTLIYISKEEIAYRLLSGKGKPFRNGFCERICSLPMVPYHCRGKTDVSFDQSTTRSTSKSIHSEFNPRSCQNHKQRKRMSWQEGKHDCGKVMGEACLALYEKTRDDITHGLQLRHRFFPQKHKTWYLAHQVLKSEWKSVYLVFSQ